MQRNGNYYKLLRLYSICLPAAIFAVVYLECLGYPAGNKLLNKTNQIW